MSHQGLLASRYSNLGAPARSINGVQWDQIASIQQKLYEGFFTLETPGCTLCNYTSSYRQLAERDRYSLKHSVVCCTNCGLI